MEKFMSLKMFAYLLLLATVALIMFSSIIGESYTSSSFDINSYLC